MTLERFQTCVDRYRSIHGVSPTTMFASPDSINELMCEMESAYSYLSLLEPRYGEGLSVALGKVVLHGVKILPRSELGERAVFTYGAAHARMFVDNELLEMYDSDGRSSITAEGMREAVATIRRLRIRDEELISTIASKLGGKGSAYAGMLTGFDPAESAERCTKKRKRRRLDMG